MRFRRTVEECPGFPRFPCLPVEVVEKIIHMCWLKDMGEDDHRINGGLVYPNFDNINPAKTWAIKKRIWALSQVNKHLNQLCHQLLWNVSHSSNFLPSLSWLYLHTSLSAQFWLMVFLSLFFSSSFYLLGLILH